MSIFSPKKITNSSDEWDKALVDLLSSHTSKKSFDIKELKDYFKNNPDVLQEIIIDLRKDKIDKIRKHV